MAFGEALRVNGRPGLTEQGFVRKLDLSPIINIQNDDFKVIPNLDVLFLRICIDIIDMVKVNLRDVAQAVLAWKELDKEPEGHNGRDLSHVRFANFSFSREAMDDFLGSCEPFR